MANDYEISSIEELVGVLGEPHAMIKEKVMNHLDEPMVEFINRSPLLFLSTQDEAGLADVSPKGDAPGFVEVESSKQLLIPDRPGNKLAYGHKNILANNKVGLIFVVPNLRETLRVKGVARISRDPALLEKLAAKGKPALLCTCISVEETFFHCGKAMIRSKMWQPDSWGDSKNSLLVRQIVKGMSADEELAKVIESGLEQNYREELY
jgi:PPOX class probable FMN-dependent enzyme